MNQQRKLLKNSRYFIFTVFLRKGYDDMNQLDKLRKEIDQINQELLKLLNERAKRVVEVGKEKAKSGLPPYDPVREQEILNQLIKKNEGPFSDEAIIHLFKEVFKASILLQTNNRDNNLLVSKHKKQKTEIHIKDQVIGGEQPTFIFGPCSIESLSQLEMVAKVLKKKGLKYIRGGAYKPRTSPYEFQGLGIEGLKIMKQVAEKYDLLSVVEIMDKEQLSESYDYIDIIQIGARNMHNFSLLKDVGSADKPVILKRGFSATLEEFKYSAEYIMSSGNSQVILCERGIRTFENATRNTLDISAIPILKRETHLPILVDISHAAGRRDILTSLALASLAAGCNGIMAEVHPNPKIALSDASQQMDLTEFESFYHKILS